jgi:hypothetical protein
MLRLIEQLIKEWLKRNIHDEVFVLNHVTLEEIPVGWDIVIKIEMWQPVTTTKAPKYE